METEGREDNSKFFDRTRIKDSGENNKKPKQMTNFRNFS